MAVPGLSLDYHPPLPPQGYSATGGRWMDGSPGIVLGLPQLLWCTGILCHWGGGGVYGCPGIVLRLPQLLWCTGILCHGGEVDGWLSGPGTATVNLVPGTGILCHVGVHQSNWGSPRTIPGQPYTSLPPPCGRVSRDTRVTVAVPGLSQDPATQHEIFIAYVYNMYACTITYNIVSKVYNMNMSHF